MASIFPVQRNCKIMNSLSTRLAIVISAVLFVLMTIAGFWIDKELTRAITLEEKNQAKAHASTLMASLQTLMLNGQGTLAREWLDRMHGEEGIIDIEVLRKDGKEAFTDTSTVDLVNDFIQVEQFSRTATPPHHSAPPPEAVFSRALKGSTAFDTSIPGQLSVYLPIEADTACLSCHGYDQSGLRGVLKLSLSTISSSQRINTMRRSLWGVETLLVGLLGLSLWATLRFSVLRPIDKLRKAITLVGQGERKQKLLIDRHDELGKVAEVFNQMQDQIEDTEVRIRAVTDNVVDAIVTIDETGEIESVNPAVVTMFGYVRDELIGKNISMLMPEPYRNQHDRYIKSYLASGNAKILGKGREVQGVTKSGKVFPMDLAVSEMWVGNTRYFIGIMRDITERKEHQAEVEYQALHDALTNLPNRALLADRLQQAIMTAKRESRAIALLIMDLDHFKDINDTLGHHHGDIVLQKVAHRMLAVLRKSDTVARLGGDEFAILLPAADLEHAIDLSEKLLNVLEDPIEIDEYSFLIGGSIGIALFPEHGVDGSTLMRRADVAMYVAKRENRGYAVYELTQDQHSLKNLSLMSELRSAIDNEELQLYYQPVIDLQKGKIGGVEALVRWQHPRRGLLYPDSFIPMAEQTGLIGALSVWVLKQATQQSAVWAESGIELRVAVNLSVRNLHDVRFPEQVYAIVESGEARPTLLRLEITETAIMSDPDRALEILNRLSAMGVRVSIDDFGTGYSSLAYLKQLPVDEIKIDKSFVMGMAVDENDAVIVRSTIDLAHNIGLKVVAEGVEDQTTYDLLRGLHCDSAQGFLMSKPLTLKELNTWLTESRWGNKQRNIRSIK